MIQLGDYVQDSLTSYEGYVVNRAEELHGCTSYGVESIESGKPVKIWFNEGRLIPIDRRQKRDAGFDVPNSD